MTATSETVSGHTREGSRPRMPHPYRLRALGILLAAVFACAQPATAQITGLEAAPEQVTAQTPPTAATPPDDPYPRRPQCASMFLKADWQLSFKQRTCDWIHNRMFSMTAVAGAAWSAGSSMVLDMSSEEGDSFA